MTATIGHLGTIAEPYGRIDVWLERPKWWLRPERWAANVTIYEMITEDLPAIPISFSRPFHGSTKTEAADAARDAAMRHLHGRKWQDRPESQSVDLSWPAA